MSRCLQEKIVLLADDDPDDWVLVRSAMQETDRDVDLRIVVDGEELLEYLTHRGRYEDRRLAPGPDLILLDLNMPRKDGREALAEIKANPALKRIPVVAFTTSGEEQDILRCYELGASSYLMKPCSYSGMLEMTSMICKYWLQLVELPSRHATHPHRRENPEKQCGHWTL